MTDSNLTNADLIGARLHGTDLRGARLRGVAMTDAEYDEATLWPRGFDPSEHGARLATASADVEAGRKAAPA